MVKKPEKTAGHQSHRRPYTALTLYFAVLNLILLCAVFILASMLLAQRDAETTPACEGRPSDALSETGRPEDTSRSTKGRYCYAERLDRCLEPGQEVKVHGNRSLCCGDLRDRLHTVMAKDVRSRLRQDAGKGRRLDRVKRYIRHLQNSSSTVAIRVAAHVGISTENFTYSDEDSPRIVWDRAGERSYISGGLIHGGDRMIVTTTGYYYVYSGLQFDLDPAVKHNGAVVAFIFRHVNGTRETARKLIQARESTCQRTRDGRPGPVSMHMAGIFLLQEQDEISVLTHYYHLLTKSPATTYLGVHMV